ncbi:MAG: SulP family inorganic anion transporter [Burkholderiales bacterium]|nr:SulP family inorganic anion transporter [Burkholderiales bacterium]
MTADLSDPAPAGTVPGASRTAPSDTIAARTPAAITPSRWPAWRTGYRSRDLTRDTLAGSTLAAYAVPSSIAYAQLAGMPVETGLYCYLFAGIAYALVGTSRQLAVGPTSAIALVLVATLASVAPGDPVRHAQLATVTAFLVGLIALFAALMRWGGIVHFISETVLTGFKIGAGIVIGVSQLPLLLGLPSKPTDPWHTLTAIVAQRAAIETPSLVLGVVALVALVAGHALRPRWPIPLAVVAMSLLLMLLPSVQALPIRSLGHIPGGIPWPALPPLDWREFDVLMPLALACFLLAYNEGIAAARLLARKHDYAIDPNRELLGMSAANVAIAFGHGFPSAGGLSQSLVNDEAGARSPLSLVVCSAWMVLALLFLTGLFERLPQPLLAALVLASIQGMFRIDELRQLLRVNKAEFLIAVVTILAVLGLGILKGVLVACVFSLAMLIRRLALPECVVLGRIPGTDQFASLVRHPNALPVPGTLVFRCNAALLYFNVDGVGARLGALLEHTDPPPQRIIVDLAFTTEIDLATVRMLMAFARRAAADGVTVRLANAHYRVRRLLRRERCAALLGDLVRAYSIAELVAAADGAPQGTVMPNVNSAALPPSRTNSAQ